MDGGVRSTERDTRAMRRGRRLPRLLERTPDGLCLAHARAEIIGEFATNGTRADAGAGHGTEIAANDYGLTYTREIMLR
jgi:hypothetical protein